MTKHRAKSDWKNDQYLGEPRRFRANLASNMTTYHQNSLSKMFNRVNPSWTYFNLKSHLLSRNFRKKQTGENHQTSPNIQWGWIRWSTDTYIYIHVRIYDIYIYSMCLYNIYLHMLSLVKYGISSIFCTKNPRKSPSIAALLAGKKAEMVLLVAPNVNAWSVLGAFHVGLVGIGWRIEHVTQRSC